MSRGSLVMTIAGTRSSASAATIASTMSVVRAASNSPGSEGNPGGGIEARVVRSSQDVVLPRLRCRFPPRAPGRPRPRARRGSPPRSTTSWRTISRTLRSRRASFVHSVGVENDREPGRRGCRSPGPYGSPARHDSARAGESRDLGAHVVGDGPVLRVVALEQLGDAHPRQRLSSSTVQEPDFPPAP